MNDDPVQSVLLLIVLFSIVGANHVTGVELKRYLNFPIVFPVFMKPLQTEHKNFVRFLNFHRFGGTPLFSWAVTAALRIIAVHGILPLHFLRIVETFQALF